MNSDKSVALVTGGAGGIGQAINRRLMQGGWQVMAGDLAAGAGEPRPERRRDLRRRARRHRPHERRAVRGGRRRAMSHRRRRQLRRRRQVHPDVRLRRSDASQIWEVNVAGGARVSSAPWPG